MSDGLKKVVVYLDYENEIEKVIDKDTGQEIVWEVKTAAHEAFKANERRYNKKR